MKYLLLKDLPGIPAGVIVDEQMVELKLVYSEPGMRDEITVTHGSRKFRPDIEREWFEPLEDWHMIRQAGEKGEQFGLTVPCSTPTQVKAVEAVINAAMANIFVPHREGRALNENDLDERILDARKAFEPREVK